MSNILGTLDNLRKNIYWFSDFLKGGEVNSYCKEIRQIIEKPNSTISLKRRENYLNDLLTHACNNVTYYREKRCTPELKTFPVIDKNIIKKEFDKFLSDNIKKDDLVKVVTSGSTGTPFALYHNKEKRKRNTADTIVFGELAGFIIGKKLVYFKIWNSINKKTKFTAFSQNIVVQDVTSLSEKIINELLLWLENDKSEKVLLGYASVFETVCCYLDKINYSQKINNVSAIIAISESLNHYTKDALLKYFSINAVSRYSNMENGILAQQNPDGSNEFIINCASYHVEIYKIDEDIPAAFEEIGRIVVTDLFNLAMPLIKYDTGDIGAMKWTDDGSGIVLHTIDGRRMDMVFDTKGSLVSSFTITNNMWKFQDLKQYQFIQLAEKKYKFKLNSDKQFLHEKELISEFKLYFGKDAEIDVEYVNEIPLLSSGKRKKVVNMMDNVS